MPDGRYAAEARCLVSTGFQPERIAEILHWY